jgi:hypothetical protein
MRKAMLAALLVGFVLGGATVHAQVSPQAVGAVWHQLPKPRLAIAPAPRPPVIDGRIAPDEWQAASRAGQFVGAASPKWKGIGGFDWADVQTTVWVTYDRACLYAALRCEEPEIETLRAQAVPERDGPLWNDDCVEVFLLPPGSEARFHIIVNSKGWVYDARNTDEKKRGSDWNLDGLKVAAAVSPPGKEACWSVEMAIPFAGLGVAAPKSGDVWGANFGRERWAALYRSITEFSTWSGVVGGFEDPATWGEIRFGDLAQHVALPRPFLGPTDLAAELTWCGPAARKVNLTARVASEAGAQDAGSAAATLEPGRPQTARLRAQVRTEGVQVLALLAADAESGEVLSCARTVLYVPEVQAAARRVKARLAALQEKAAAGSEFAKSISGQVAQVEAVSAEAARLLARVEGAPADEALRKAWQDLRDRAAALEGGTTFVVWTNSPYIATGPSTMPPVLGPPPTLSLQAALNEYEHVTFNVTNLTETPIEFRIDGRLPGQVGRPRSGLNTTVQKVAKYQPTVLKVKESDLPEKEDGQAMPLVELDSLGTLFVQPFSTRQVWLTVQTGGLKAGTSRQTIRVAPLSQPLPAVAVPVEMTVWNFRLADEAPIGVFCFDYSGDYAWMKSYKVNLWFRGAFPPASKGNLALDANGNLGEFKTDIDRVKQRLAEGARKFLFSYGYTGSFIEWAQKNNIPYLSDAWKRLFKQILSRMIREWREAGLGYDDFALQTIDEAHGQGVQQVIETTPLIREVDPKVRLAMTIMTDLDDLKRMAPYVDVWINRNGAMWGKDQWDFFHAEQAKGKPIWSWNMPCNPKSQPLTQFRTYGWRAMKFDFDAIGFFLYSGLVYDAYRPGGGIATRHWEAWRDGVEDYQVLWTLRQEIGKARERRVAAEKLAPAEKALAEAVDDVITDKFFPPNTQETHDRIQAARARVAAEIERVMRLK